MKKILFFFTSIFSAIFILYYFPSNVLAQCEDVECEEPMTCVYTCGELSWMCEPITDGCSCSGCRAIPTNTPTPTPYPTSPPSGCCSTVDDCTPTPGYNTYCNEAVPGCPVYRCSYKLISCWCPDVCRPGQGGCFWSDGSGLPLHYYNCGDECCDTGTCPTLPPAPTGSTIRFSDLIDVTLPSSRFTSGTTLGSIITILLPYIYGAAGLAMLLFLVLGAYQIMISSGDPKQMAAGREKITYAIVGFVIMFAAYWITRIAGEILNIQQIQAIFS